MRRVTAAAGPRWPVMPRLGPVGTAVLLAAVALSVSMATIGHESLWFDEGVTLRVGRFPREPFLETLFTREPFWALYYVVMRPWIELADGAVYLRLPSAVAASATVGLTYLVGRRLIGERGAVIGALVLVPHGFLLQYAQEARGYALAAFLAVACTLAFVHASERPSWIRWALYGFLGIAAVYAHFFAALVIGAHVLALVCQRREWLQANWRYPAAALSIIGIAALPLASWLLAAEQTRRFVRPITPDRVVATFAWFGGANVIPTNPVYYLLAAAAVVAIGLVTAHLVAWTRSTERPWRPVLLGAWLLLPLTLGLVISMTIKPVFTYRYLIVSLPALALGIGLVLARIRGPMRRAGASALVAALLMMGGWSVLFTTNKPDWNGAARLVLESDRPGDVVIMQPGWQWTPMSYAMDQATTGPIPERRLTRSRPHHAEASLDRIRREGSRIWLIVFDYRSEPRLDSYPFLDLLEVGRRRVMDEFFYDVRVMLYEPVP